MGKIETFDKNRDLKETQIAKKKSIYRDPGLLIETLVTRVKIVLKTVLDFNGDLKHSKWGPRTFKIGTQCF